MSSVGEVTGRLLHHPGRQQSAHGAGEFLQLMARLPCEPGGDGRSQDIVRISQDDFGFGIIGNTKSKSF